MTTLSEWFRRFWGTFRRSPHDSEMEEEIRLHLELAAEHMSEQGESHDEARRKARLKAGAIPQSLEAMRDQRGLPWLEDLIRDVRYGLRSLRRNSGVTAVAVAILALGIGANTALFTVVNEMFIRKLPVRDPDSLVRLRVAGPNDMITVWLVYGNMTKEGDLDVLDTFSYPTFQEFLKHNQTLDYMTASAPIDEVNLFVDGAPELATAFVLSGNYYALLGVEPSIGRTITTDDDRPGSAPVAMISHGYWTRRFGRNAEIIGKTIRANNLLVTIIGVTPPEFTGMWVGAETPGIPDISFPLALDSQLTVQSQPRVSQGTYWWLNITGRLKPGMTAQQVRGNLAGVFQQSARAGLDEYLSSPDADERRSPASNRERTRIPQLRVSSASRGLYDVDRDEILTVGMVGVVVILLLLIVCANIASLLLARAVARQKEVSIRLSMGATRARLIRQLLTESVMIALAGAVLGIVVAYVARQVWQQSTGPFLDWRVLGFTAGLAILTGIVFGIAPAFRATRRNIGATLKHTSRSVIGSRSLAGKSLLALQVAVSVMVLIGAGLFLRTVQNLRRVDVGFDPSNIALFRLNPGLNGYDQARIRTLYEQIVERLTAEPGVLSVGVSSGALLSGSAPRTFFINANNSAADSRIINSLTAGPGFLETMGIPVIAGRTFTWKDDQSGPKVAMINEAAAQKYFPNENPLGQRFGDRGSATVYEIIGIVRDTKWYSLREPSPPTRYMPYLQRPLGEATFELRTLGDPSNVMAAVRHTVQEIDPTVPLTDLGTQVRMIEDRLDREKTFAGVYAMFGGLALLLSSLGLFGLMSYSVRRRTNEIGIRIALGAKSQDVVKMVMGESMLIVSIGVVAGLAGAFAAGRLIESLLFGLSPTDGVTIGTVILVIIIVSATAGYLPARRASRVDPLTVLRYE